MKSTLSNLKITQVICLRMQQKVKTACQKRSPRRSQMHQKVTTVCLKRSPRKKSNEETKSDDGSNTETQNEVNNTEDGGTEADDSEGNEAGQRDSEENSTEKKPDTDETETKSDENAGEDKDRETGNDQIDEKVDQKDDKESEKSSDGQANNQSSGELLPSGAQSELSNETSTQSSSWSTQAAESKNEKETQQSSNQQKGYNWKLCNVTAGPDYIPCLDNLQAIRSLRSTKHYEHRERHCPEEPPTCLVQLPEGYKRPIEWPTSREKGEFLTFPGGGTQFQHGALHYIDFVNESVPDIAWGKRTRVILDVGCGVASFGGYICRDGNKEASLSQAEFFDAVHCARCRVPWHIEGGKLLLELNRVLRPGGFFVWSATPVYQKLDEDVEIWQAMSELTKAMCWELVSVNKDALNGVGVATYRKPTSNDCYEKRSKQEPPLCKASDDPNAAWNLPLQACMHKVPVDSLERGSQWPEEWPARLDKTPYWMLSSQVGVYGKPAPEDFTADYEHWKRVVSNSYLNGIGLNWSSVRNAMDMRSVYGGFAAALKELNVWVMNVVTVDSPDTLPIIYERGLFGIYHDWCESFNTYPRSYDLLHADHLFSKVKKRCNLVAVFAEVDRILRPEGKLIVRDKIEIINELENMARSMHWEVSMTYSKDKEGLLCVQKSTWRPKESETITYAIA
ncbi:PMT26-LIKE PROTEIN putative-RELATED [Salix viminalis]|uniref:Methyltransferase n=1 Tax=Salix viminalis TaxID=40686 RepID=A0A9Q0UVP4_SALVM|nr:PMT26-LIKE PROTEIN putative-RELATED [Salix viminalis]